MSQLQTGKAIIVLLTLVLTSWAYSLKPKYCEAHFGAELSLFQPALGLDVVMYVCLLDHSLC